MKAIREDKPVLQQMLVIFERVWDRVYAEGVDCSSVILIVRPELAYGVDLLVVVDLRSRLFTELGTEFLVFYITHKTSIEQLGNATAQKSRLTPTFERK